MAGSKLTALTDLAGGQVSTDLAYVVDVSAGANGSKKSTLNDLFEQITKNITDAVLKGIDGSGTNGAGGSFDLSGGRGTGNASPGQLAVRYPLRTGSGSTLQSLSTDRFPLSSSLYAATSDGTSIANTTTETSLFTGALSGAGSTRSIEAGSASPGSVYRVYVMASYTTTGTPTIRLKIKLGSTIIGDTTAFNATTGTANGRFWIEGYIFVDSVGATGQARVEMYGLLFPAPSGTATPLFFAGSVGAVAVDFTASQTIDVTLQWGTASASNVATLVRASIERLR